MWFNIHVIEITPKKIFKKKTKQIEQKMVDNDNDIKEGIIT
jgi:hypothetical protein